MEPKLVFLGTGYDSIVVGKQLCASGGIVLQVDDNQLMIDPGPGAIVRAKQYGINIRDTDAILVSSNNLFQCNDVNVIIDAMTVGGLDKKGVLLCYDRVVEQGIVLGKYLNNVERVILMEEGKRIGVNDIEIIALPVKNYDGVGFKIHTSYFNMIYSGHTDFDNSILEEYKNTDLLVLNVTSPTEWKEKGHLSTEDAIKVINYVKPKLTIITGYSIKMLESDPINEARIIQRETHCQTIAAKDGMVLTPMSYSVHLSQTNLKYF